MHEYECIYTWHVLLFLASSPYRSLMITREKHYETTEPRTTFQKSTISLPTRQTTTWYKNEYLRIYWYLSPGLVKTWTSETAVHAQVPVQKRQVPRFLPSSPFLNLMIYVKRCHNGGWTRSPPPRSSWFTSAHNDNNRITAGLERGHVSFFQIKMPSAKIRGTRFDVPGDREKRFLGDPTKEDSKATSWSHRFSCGSRFVSTARCGRVDPLRRLVLRLVYSTTNLRRAKTR